VAKRILLADDSLTIQKVVELTFSDSEYDLVCVSNGQRALEKVNESAPDLILADVVMPEKNGYEVCEAIKSNPATARIPVVLLSGTFEPFDRDRAERLGCDAIVSKPFDS
jgi:CheY-like chemotaxis protein